MKITTLAGLSVSPVCICPTFVSLLKTTGQANAVSTSCSTVIKPQDLA
jgi:hypothetical protein